MVAETEAEAETDLLQRVHHDKAVCFHLPLSRECDCGTHSSWQYQLYVYWVKLDAAAR